MVAGASVTVGMATAQAATQAAVVTAVPKLQGEEARVQEVVGTA